MQIGSQTIAMNTGAYVGLAVCSHENGTLNTSLLDNISASFLPANTAPTLAPMTNWTVNVGQTVSLTATATDPDSPPQTLAFTLVSGLASTFSQVNNTNLAYGWRPTVADANSTNTVILKVGDNGFPSLSDTQAFSVAVNPLTVPALSSVALLDGQFTMQLDGQTGPDYAVQVSTNLTEWNTLLITNSPAMPWTWTDTNTASLPVRFYRLKVGPPLP